MLTFFNTLFVKEQWNNMRIDRTVKAMLGIFWDSQAPFPHGNPLQTLLLGDPSPYCPSAALGGQCHGCRGGASLIKVTSAAPLQHEPF